MARCRMFTSLTIAAVLVACTPEPSPVDQGAVVGASRLGFPLHGSMTHLCDFDERIYLEEGPHISVDVELWTSPRPAAELSGWYENRRAEDPGPWATRPATPDQAHHREVDTGAVADAGRGNGMCTAEAPHSAVSAVRLADGWW